MPRRPREDEAGAMFHLMNRGIAKRPLFEDREDIRFFLACLARAVRGGLLEVHSWCVMTTHYHLLARSLVGRLSEAMLAIQRETSRTFNRRHRRDGALVRGRFGSRRVRTLEYRRTLVRYIDANPVRAGIVNVPWEYPWSSARQYVRRDGPRWLTRDWVEEEIRAATGREECTPETYFEAFGGGSDDAIARLVEARWRLASTEEDPMDDLIGSATEQVRRWMVRKARLADGLEVGEPVCAAAELIDACKSSPLAGETGSISNRRTLTPLQTATVGLLRTLARSRWEDVMRAAGLTETTSRRALQEHQRLLLTDQQYLDRIAEISAAALRRCHGR